jgi:hypothetical protein
LEGDPRHKLERDRGTPDLRGKHKQIDEQRGE